MAELDGSHLLPSVLEALRDMGHMPIKIDVWAAKPKGDVLDADKVQARVMLQVFVRMQLCVEGGCEEGRQLLERREAGEQRDRHLAECEVIRNFMAGVEGELLLSPAFLRRFCEIANQADPV
ncbi:hypothetical protein ACFV2Z_40235 [Streptomyces sp. NPDC059688]|uniref:hypothetical protein n=1 Tax=Streptomyces sp. NPDC059688 TaxID=3346906 RepID=UPI0036A6265D